MKSTGLIAVCLLLLAAVPARAQVSELSEVRVAVMQHDVTHLKYGDRESGIDVEVQLISEPVEALAILGRPRAYVSGSLNSDGDTNFAAVGVVWRRTLNDRWSAEYQFGYAIHDGELDSNDPAVASANLMLGSRDLFRSAFGLDYHFNERWSLGFQWVHLSHGEIIGEGRNQGLDSAGLRVGRKF